MSDEQAQRIRDLEHEVYRLTLGLEWVRDEADDEKPNISLIGTFVRVVLNGDITEEEIAEWR